MIHVLCFLSINEINEGKNRERERENCCLPIVLIHTHHLVVNRQIIIFYTKKKRKNRPIVISFVFIVSSDLVGVMDRMYWHRVLLEQYPLDPQ